jgi:BirA family biotin operon repressor/biotin-[acetyl-CoA-carboxylase] ligase
MKAESLKRLQDLIWVMSDGKFHSGQALAEHLGVSRTAIWKLVGKLESWQIPVYAVRGKGYKIPEGLELIDPEILNGNVLDKLSLFSEIEVLPTVDSTSSYLTRTWKDKPGIGRICIAEHQTMGRGRKGRKWVSPFGANLYFSLGLNLPMGLSALGGLSLAIGIGLTKLLNHHSKQKVALKWPNDLLVGQKKMAGILVEASGDSNDKSFLNIGIGVNWNMQLQQSEIDQPWINLTDVLKDDVDRNQILASILISLDQMLVEYMSKGFDSFRNEWNQQSAYYGQVVELHTRTGKVAGKEIGVDKSGAIILATNEGEKTFYSGEVSLRANRKKLD